MKTFLATRSVVIPDGGTYFIVENVCLITLCSVFKVELFSLEIQSFAWNVFRRI